MADKDLTAAKTGDGDAAAVQEQMQRARVEVNDVYCQIVARSTLDRDRP